MAGQDLGNPQRRVARDRGELHGRIGSEVAMLRASRVLDSHIGGGGIAERQVTGRHGGRTGRGDRGAKLLAEGGHGPGSLPDAGPVSARRSANAAAGGGAAHWPHRGDGDAEAGDEEGQDRRLAGGPDRMRDRC